MPTNILIDGIDVFDLLRRANAAEIWSPELRTEIRQAIVATRRSSGTIINGVKLDDEFERLRMKLDEK